MCSKDGFCSNWDERCHSLPWWIGCTLEARELLCSNTTGVCSFNFTDLCEPFELSSFIYKYRFQLDAEFFALNFHKAYFASSSGFKSAQDIAIAIENICTIWVHQFVRFIVPFYQLVYTLLLQPLMGKFGQTMVQLVFGPNRMPLRFAQEVAGVEYPSRLTGALQSAQLGYLSRAVFVAHSHGGVVARALALTREMAAVTFESSQYDLSPLQGFLGPIDPTTEYVMVNELSGPSVFAMEDSLAKWNYRMPDWQKWWKPANPYETFCLLAAGCVADDRYDHICNESVGNEQYRNYFTSWHRKRTD
jgi:hypothetical protein